MTSYDLDRGSRWEVYYLTATNVKLDPQVEDNLVDMQTREISSNTFDPPPGLSPGEYSQLFMTHFMKSRQKSREIITKGNERIIRYKVLVQVGNPECLADLANTEKMSDFKQWENPSMIDYFRQISNEYLNG